MCDVLSETTIELIRRMDEIFLDKESIGGVLVYAEHEEDRKAILDFIEAGDDVSQETIIVLALELNDARESN